MSKLNFLIDQISETRNFANRLMAEIPEELWFIIPDDRDINFAWQIGHLLVAQNFHAITAVTGWNKQIAEQMPINEYNRAFYGMGGSHRSVNENLVSPRLLKDQLDIIHSVCLETLSVLTDDILEQPLQPLPFKHPVANTKYEALSWCFKHEMWHCAEIEEIKRLLNHPIVWM